MFDLGEMSKNLSGLRNKGEDSFQVVNEVQEGFFTSSCPIMEDKVSKSLVRDCCFAKVLVNLGGGSALLIGLLLGLLLLILLLRFLD
jgi:hypothetical protein